MILMKAFQIPEPFFWGNVIKKFALPFVSQRAYVLNLGRNFFGVAPPDLHNAAETYVMNASSLFMLASIYKASAYTLPGEAKQWTIFST